MKQLLHISIRLIIILSFILGLTGCGNTLATEVNPTATSITEPPVPSPTSTPATANIQPNEGEAWLDDSIDIMQFPPQGDLVVHFEKPILSTKDTNPILSWPAVDGVSSWNADNTTLIFSPITILASKSTYTFFLNPELRFSDGSELKDAPVWVAHIQSGPKILQVTPEAGSLNRNFKFIEISFDRDMSPSDTQESFSIQPKILYELHWKSARILQVVLEQPFTADQRYDMLLRGGTDKGALFAQDGTYLEEDYLWFYWQAPLEANVTTVGPKTVEVGFNYQIDASKSGLPLSITPDIKGTWRWAARKAIFTAEEIIPTSTEYTIALTAPMFDINGFETPKLPSLVFTGIPPIRLINDDIKKSSYSDAIFAERDVESIRLEFDVPVNHSSAERAFSLKPHLPGSFLWEKSRNGSHDVLVYMLDELLKPQASYTVTIDTSITDTNNQKIIAQPYQKSFEMPYWGYLNPSFGEAGANIQVIDANGSRRLQISGSDPDLSFTAYRFEMIDYAEIYAKHYHYRNYGGNVQDIPIPAGIQPALTWQNVSTRDDGNGQKVIETIIPPELRPGLYVLNLSVKGRLYDQLFLVVSNNTLVVKEDGDEIFVWLTNINGANVADAEIRVYSSDGEKIREGTTDENGIYKVSIPQGEQPELVFARVREKDKPVDIAIAGFDGWNSRFPYDYNDRSYLLPEGQPYLLYTYTERPIYKPGQTVNYKIIVRKDADIKYSLPETGYPVTVRVLDARKNKIETFELFTNDFGTVNSSVNIPAEAMLGLYTIETEVDGVIQQTSFQVEDYRKPDYQINITSLQPEKENKFVRGEEIRMDVNVSYYFGEPLANTKLDVDFFVAWPVSTKINSPVVTDENGNATLIFNAPYDEEQADYYGERNFRKQFIRMEVTANDGSNQTVAGVYNFQVYPSSEIMDLTTTGYYFEPGKAIAITAQVADLFDNPIAGRNLTLTAHTWNRTTFEFDHAEQTISLTTDEKGIAKQEIKLNSGYHKLVLSGEDSLGHKTESTKWIYVFKNKNDWFYRIQEEQLLISAEKESYKPYERASFAIESTFSGPALITFERGSVINSKLIELTAPLTIFETEIIPEHAPNVYVTVNAWQAASENVHRYRYWYSAQTEADSYLRLAKTQIAVDASMKELDINITTNQQTYEPGEQVSATIQVKDTAGNPVAAELSLAVVDEAIFGLADDSSVDIFDAFYGPRRHTVETSDSMAPYRIIIEGGMGGGSDTPPAAARSDFPDTSAWLPVIVTDTNGQGTVTFELPDNITSWRLTVKAVTKNHKVGQAYINIETKKDVFIRPILPRVLTHGDQATLTAFIHNYSSHEREITVSLIADGLEVQGQNEDTITLQPGEVLPIGWQVHVNKSSPTEVIITARETSNVLDVIRLPILIQPAAIRDVQNQSGQITGAQDIALILPNLELESSHVYLTLNTTIGGTLLNGLEYLTGYPYGCVEQTMSRALPNAVVGRASEQLGIGGQALQMQVDPLIKASITKLYSLQHSDGGWGWWTDDASDEYQTAWVLFGLGIMQDSGYIIEPKVIENASKWLKDSIGYNQNVDIRTQAYSLYSLAQAGQGDLAATQTLASNSIQELDPFSQAALALALHKLGDEQKAREILDLLSRSAVKTRDVVYYPQPTYDGNYHRKTMSSTIRTTALALLAYAEIDPQNPLIPGMVEYLASQRKGMYGWGTTNETSFTILALTHYLVSQEEEIGDTPYEIIVNEKKIFEGILQPGKASVVLDIPLTGLKLGLNKLTVSTQGANPIYYDLSTSYDLLGDVADAAGKIKVTRSYLDPTTDKPVQDIQAGQLIKVAITVQVPENTYFLAVEDYLPGGLEALNEGLNATSQVSYGMWGEENSRPFFWEDYGYNYKEIRGDRVVFFITNFKEGTHTFIYYTRAISAGKFTALPTQVYAMYDQSMWGRSDTAYIEVR